MIEEVISAMRSRKSPTYDAYRARVQADGGTVELDVAGMREHYELLPDAQWCHIASGRKIGKLYTINPNNSAADLPFDRASKATAWNKNGKLVEVPSNMPAFDWDPLTGKFRGVNVCAQGTNRIPNSSNTTYASVSNVTIAPHIWGFTDLYTHAVFFGDNSINRSARKFFITISGLGDVIVSAFIEMEDGSEPRVGRATDPNADLIIGIGGGNFLDQLNPKLFMRQVSPTVWYISAYCHYLSTSANNYISKAPGNSNKPFKMVGFHLEQGTKFPGRHVITTGTSATKLYDNLNRDIVLNVGICTVFADVYIRYSASALPYGVIFNCPDTNNRIMVGFTADGRANMLLLHNGVQVLHIKDAGPAHSHALVKIAARIENGNYALFVNGEKFAAFTTGSNAVVNPFTATTRMILGEMSSNMNFRSIKVLPACTDTQLKSLTTL